MSGKIYISEITKEFSAHCTKNELPAPLLSEKTPKTDIDDVIGGKA